MKTTQNLRIFAAALLALAIFAAPGFSEEGAKDLFYKQQASPTAVLNNGMQYWIELNRGGQVLPVSNKFAFKSGDKIRIHMKANVEAFAYVMLREGSSGEKSVLYPDARFHDNNKFKASVDYQIPQTGYLAFDSTPGTEKVILLISRQALDAEKYLDDKTKLHASIAATPNSTKDQIPGSVMLAYSVQDASAGSKSALLTPAIKLNAIPAPSNDQAVTTLVQTDPMQVLAVDLALLHEP